MKVAIVMGSKSDYSKLEEGINFLKKYDVEVIVRILSAHRTPKELVSFIESIEDEVDVIIPVVGLPIKSSTMDGMDSLLSMVQMPKGIPVATVTIDSGLNAALMAMQIMSIKYLKLKQDLKLYRKEMEQKVLDDDKSINQ